jgi:hypothetical protein
MPVRFVQPVVKLINTAKHPLSFGKKNNQLQQVLALHRVQVFAAASVIADRTGMQMQQGSQFFFRQLCYVGKAIKIPGRTPLRAALTIESSSFKGRLLNFLRTVSIVFI